MVSFQPVTVYTIRNFFKKIENTNGTKPPHMSYSDGLTKIKNWEITGNCIWKPHLGNLSASGNLDEFQLHLESFSQAEQSFWIFRSLNFLLLMKTLVSVFVLRRIKSDFYTLTSTLGETESLACKKVTKPEHWIYLLWGELKVLPFGVWMSSVFHTAKSKYLKKLL